MHTIIVSKSAGTSHHHVSTVGNCQPPIRQTLPIKSRAHERGAATMGGSFTLADRSVGDLQLFAVGAVLPGPSNAQIYAGFMSMGVAKSHAA
jgi:hypothetical protein